MSVVFAEVQISMDGDILEFHADIPDNELVAFQASADAKYHTWGATHKFCRGFLDWHNTTHTLQVITCRGCHLRVTVPRTVKTIGDLRAWSKQNFRLPANQRGSGAAERRRFTRKREGVK